MEKKLNRKYRAPKERYEPPKIQKIKVDKTHEAPSMSRASPMPIALE